MANSNYLSNYDKDTVNKLKESKLLIIDLDGTLINFEKIDNIIIASLFPESRVINSIDNILWKINRLDLFGNGYAGLKLRLAFYSLFSEYTFEECFEGVFEAQDYYAIETQILKTKMNTLYEAINKLINSDSIDMISLKTIESIILSFNEMDDAEETTIPENAFSKETMDTYISNLKDVSAKYDDIEILFYKLRSKIFNMNHNFTSL